MHPVTTMHFRHRQTDADIVAYKAQDVYITSRAKNRPHKGRGYGHVTYLNS